MSKIFHDVENNRIDFLDERYYKAGDNFYPSVTFVLESYPKGYGFIEYLKSQGNNAEVELKKAGDEGSLIHDAIDMYLKGEQVVWNDEVYSFRVWTQILKIFSFFETHKPEIIENEVSITSDKYRIGGTIDLICRLNGELWLIDYKSSNALYKTHELQISAYATMWNEVFPDKKIDKTGILWTKAQTRGEDKSGKKIQGKGWQLKEPERHYTDAFEIFKHTLAIFNEENPNAKPKNITYPDRIKREGF